MPVFFDNLQVRHDRGRILEENHYYAYGLKIASISSRAFANTPPSGGQGGFQGDYNEFDDDLGWNDFTLRSYDPQTGRFLQNDPFEQFASGYVGMGNDPVNGVDPSGGFLLGASSMFNATLGGAVLGTVVGGGVALATGENPLKGAAIGAGAGALAGLGSGLNWGSMAASTAVGIVGGAGQIAHTIANLGPGASYTGGVSSSVNMPDVPLMLAQYQVPAIQGLVESILGGAAGGGVALMPPPDWSSALRDISRVNAKQATYVLEVIYSYFLTSGQKQGGGLIAVKTIIENMDVIAHALNPNDDDSYKVYSLNSLMNTELPLMKRGTKGPVGKVSAKVGRVWKYGTTNKPLVIGPNSNVARYGPNDLPKGAPVYPVTLYKGNLLSALFVEKTLLLKYWLEYGTLPPGNKIVK